jgi:Protein of unknown function (DUF2778)
MSRTAARRAAVNALPRRAIAPRGERRTIGGSVAIGLGTVTAAGGMTGAVVIGAAWMISVSLASNAALGARSAVALDTTILTKPYTFLSGAADFSAWARIMPQSGDRPDVAATLARTSEQGATTDDAPLYTASLPAADAAMALPTPRPAVRAAETTTQTTRDLTLAVPLPMRRPSNGAQAQQRQDAAAVPARPAGTQLASATPESTGLNLLQKDLTAPVARNAALELPGPGSRTALYDIDAHVVYLPNGDRLEAHSGLGSSMDDPRFAREHDRGPTPPNVYNLVLRDGLFHGVQAIRLNPVDDSKMFGRAGILAHPYMLGPSGQSFGCVSFKDYPEFLRAFQRGEFDRMVVVSHLQDRPPNQDDARRKGAASYALSYR